MKQLKFLFVALGFLIAISVHSQEMPRRVFAASGGHGSGSNIELSWTIGQSGLIGTSKKPSIILNMGFQQFDNLLVSIEDIVSDMHFNMYPNPFRNHFNLDIQTQKLVDVNIQLYDNYGRLVLSENIGEKSLIVKQTIQTQGLTPGVYSLLVTTHDENNAINTKYFKLIKQ
jgi:hypothetical protein